VRAASVRSSSALRVLAAATALAGAAASSADADVQSFDFGTRNLTNAFADNRLTITPTIPGIVRGVYVSGTWTHVSGLNNAGEFQYEVDGPGAADLAGRTQGGSAATPFVFGDVPTRWSNGIGHQVFLRYRGEYIANFAPAASGPWTFGLRNGSGGTLSTFTNTRLHVLTDAAAPVSGSLTPTSPQARLAFRLNATTGAPETDNGIYRFESFTFTARATGMHLFTSLFSNGLEGRLFVYDRPIDLENPTRGNIGTDIDTFGASGFLDFNSAAVWLGLTAGRTYTVAVGTRQPLLPGSTGLTGDFTTFIAGPVPTPGAAGLFALAGAWCTPRRRRALLAPSTPPGRPA
jgi:hypothetical protein